MKLFLTIVFCVWLSQTLALPNPNVFSLYKQVEHLKEEDLQIFHSDVNEDIQDFINLWPWLSIYDKVRYAVEHDEEVAKDYDYIASAYYLQHVIELQQIDEYKDMANRLESGGVNVTYWNEKYNDYLKNLPHFNSSDAVKGEGLKGLLQNLEKDIPRKRIYVLFTAKYVYSIDFRRYIAVLMDYEYRQSIYRFEHSDKYLQTEKEMIAMGFDMDAYKEFLNKIPHII